MLDTEANYWLISDQTLKEKKKFVWNSSSKTPLYGL